MRVAAGREATATRTTSSWWSPLTTQLNNLTTPDQPQLNTPDQQMVSPDHVELTKEHQPMQPIEFIGIRGGHGTTTVALAAAVTLATRAPTRVATHDRRALCALVGIAHDGLPIPLTEHLELASGGIDGDVIDAGTLETNVDAAHSDEATWEGPSGALRIGVLRGPDYLGVRTLCDHAAVRLDGLVVVSEAGRALDARDVEQNSGRPVVAVVDHTPSVACTIDAGMLMSRVGRLREFAQLRSWVIATALEEAPCASFS